MLDSVSSTLTVRWVIGGILCLFVIYAAALAFYRLFLSPISSIPGPKMAACTFWYEFYYDVVQRGRYTWKIADLHKQYGPIIRINPYEVHINDPDYYDELYTGPTKVRDKWAWSAAMFGNSSSHFGAISHDEHRIKRAPLNQFFSKRSVAKLEPMIVSKVEQLCTRLRGFQQTKQPVNLRHAFAALTMDVVTEYAFANSYNCLEDPDFAPIWPEAVDSISEQSHLNKQFPWLLPIMRLTPLWMVKRLNPHMMRLINFQMDMMTQVTQILNGKNIDNEAEHPTIFHSVLQTAQLLPGETLLQRAVDEGQSVVAAGQVTTTHYLNTVTYHILSNPPILNNLLTELTTLLPTPSTPLPPLDTLESLPYLTAVITEGYRLSYGVTHRLQRVSPLTPLSYPPSYTIPPGTPISMTSVLIHSNPTIFPDPHTFRPERWLSEPPNNATNQSLKKYLVNFSRGTRGCLGQHLAQAEIYLCLAALLRRFEFEIYDTTRQDIDVAHDFFNPQPRKGAVGLRVLVK